MKQTKPGFKEARKINNFKNKMQFQIKRSRQYYKNSQKGLAIINDLNSRFVATIIKTISSSMLDEIENNDYNIFPKRIQVSKIKKLLVIPKVIPKREYLCA